MKKLIKRFVVAYPSGNTTAIIFDNLESIDKKQLNEAILKTWKAKYPDLPEIEQCCFIEKPSNPKSIARMQMFGGEFCGNASRSAVWLLTEGRNSPGYIEVSGTKELLAFQVKDREVTIEMPLPKYAKLVRSVPEGTLVQLDGITQLVVTDKTQRPRTLLTTLLKDGKYSLAEQPAVGVSYYDKSSGRADFCVWVNTVDTIFDETACGSGTCAIGISLAVEAQNSVSLPVIQPSGETITTQAIFENGCVTRSSIAGKVRILYDGEFTLS
jgi:histidine racemase